MGFRLQKTKCIIYKWQNGQSLPAIENLVVLAKMMDTTVDDLLVVNEGNGLSKLEFHCLN